MSTSRILNDNFNFVLYYFHLSSDFEEKILDSSFNNLERLNIKSNQLFCRNMFWSGKGLTNYKDT